MYIEKEDLYTAIDEFRLSQIAPSDVGIRWAILAAIDEARGYLAAKYDCAVIFAATGDDRNATLVEHIKNIAIWYLCRRSNSDIIFEQVGEYRKAAIDWLEKVAGMKDSDKPLAPGLPLLTDESGAAKISMRMGSRRKFSHSFDD